MRECEEECLLILINNGTEKVVLKRDIQNEQSLMNLLTGQEEKSDLVLEAMSGAVYSVK